MQVNSINSVSPTNNDVQETEVVSLNKRLAETQQTSGASNASTAEQTTFDEIMDWIGKGREQFLTDPKFMSEQINAMIKKMVDEKGNKVVKGFSDVLEQMTAIKEAVQEAGYDELNQFFYDEVARLMGINFFMQDFLNQAMYPTVQNFGKLEAYEF